MRSLSADRRDYSTPADAVPGFTVPRMRRLRPNKTTVETLGMAEPASLHACGKQRSFNRPGRPPALFSLPLAQHRFVEKNIKYRRILLKLSGEALLGEQEFGIDDTILDDYAREIKSVVDAGVEVAIVIGGGNIFRGVSSSDKGMTRAHADYMGMLATMINAMALQDGLENVGVYTRLQSSIKMEQIAEPFIRRRAMRHLEKGRVVIFGSGTGNPYFTTDTAAALRALEIDANVILKGTRVDGVFSDDPEKNADASRFSSIHGDEVISRDLRVMDRTAFTLCGESGMPIIIFNINVAGNLLRVVQGQQVGTLVYWTGDPPQPPVAQA